VQGEAGEVQGGGGVLAVAEGESIRGKESGFDTVAAAGVTTAREAAAANLGERAERAPGNTALVSATELWNRFPYKETTWAGTWSGR
jgi:hypothetical protein